MVKNALFLLCFLAGYTSTLQAQEVRLDSVTDNSFSGLINSANMNTTYFYYIDGADGNKNVASLVVKHVSNQFNDLHSFKIEISKSTFVQSSAAADVGFVFVLADPIAKTRKTILLDFAGRLLKQNNEEGVDVKLLSGDDMYYLSGIMPMGVIAAYKSNTKGGYTVCKYDNDLKQEWTKEIVSSSDGRIDIIGLKVLMDKVVVLTRETRSGKQQIIQSRLMTFSGQDGSIIADNMLKDGEDYCVPTFINFTEATCTLGGEYYKDGKYNQGAALGMMLMQFDESGQKMKTVKIPIASIHPFLPDADISTISSKGMLLALDGYSNDKGSLSMICEVVDNNYVESAKQSEVAVSDLMCITIDIEGNMEKLELVRNITPIKATLKGNLATGSVLGLSNWLIRNKLLHYRFSTQAEGASHICYYNVDHNKPHIIFAPATDLSSGKDKEPLLLRLPEMESKVKWTAKIVVDGTANASRKCYEWRKVDMLPAVGSYIRSYNFMAPQLVIAQERNF